MFRMGLRYLVTIVGSCVSFMFEFVVLTFSLFHKTWSVLLARSDIIML